MELDGSNRMRLTRWPSYETNPVWSEDGSRVFFDRPYRVSPMERGTYSMAKDGTDTRHISLKTRYIHPQTLRGNRVVHTMFAVNPGENDPDQAETTAWYHELRTDTRMLDNSAHGWPATVAEGTAQEDGLGGTLAITDPDGTNPTAYRNMKAIQHQRKHEEETPYRTEWIEGAPSWSPDGQKVAYMLVSYEGVPTAEIIKYLEQGHEQGREDGTRPPVTRRLHILYVEESRTEKIALPPRECQRMGYDSNWSPDSRYLLMNAGRLCIADLESGTASVLVEGKAGRWSPDGEWIVVQNHCPRAAHNRLICGNHETGQDFVIFKIRPDGTGVMPLARLDGKNSHKAAQ